VTDEMRAGSDELEPEEQQFESGTDGHPPLPPSMAHEGPVLFLSAWPQATIAEMLSLLPSRLITDRMIARFFEGMEPSWSRFTIGQLAL
jgi:hypothetical protein